MPEHQPRRLRPLPESVPTQLSADFPARAPLTPDQPWVTGESVAEDTFTGHRHTIDLAAITEAWLRERLGNGADELLVHLERIRSVVSESNFAAVLAGVVSELM